VEGAGDVSLVPGFLRPGVHDQRRLTGCSGRRKVGGIGLIGEFGGEKIMRSHGHVIIEPPGGADWNSEIPVMETFCRMIPGIISDVPNNQRITLDRTDESILRALQADGRISTADLARAVSLSASSTADRVRRLVDAGIITGYAAIVDSGALGYDITAFVRMAYPSGNYKPLHDLFDVVPEVVEAHHVTGNDCFIMKVVARSMSDLERITGKLAALGSITTSVVYSSPLPGRPISPS
jgi:Lrp/AsnC family transcriptional regulator, leucine-responsive regulatory protein